MKKHSKKHAEKRNNSKEPITKEKTTKSQNGYTIITLLFPIG